jgi:DNA-binding response OmpR family regulator
MTVADTDEPPTVLVVEDESSLAEAYTRWLSASYRVLTAENGEAALDAIDESVDVVLLDRRMPELSGDEALGILRNREYDCRVAIVTAAEPDFDIIGMGFDTYLIKPVTKSDLDETVERLLLLAEYDQESQELFALARTRAVLEVQKTERELAASEEYAALVERFEACRTDLDRSIDRMDDELLAASFRLL